MIDFDEEIKKTRFGEVDKMLDYEEELKKFKPSLEVEDAEDAIYNNDVPDITDLINKIVEDLSDK